MCNVHAIYVLSVHSEARPGGGGGGLWGLSPPKFVKVSPSITEDEYIYTIKTQLKCIYIYSIKTQLKCMYVMSILSNVDFTKSTFWMLIL